MMIATIQLSDTGQPERVRVDPQRREGVLVISCYVARGQRIRTVRLSMAISQVPEFITAVQEAAK